ncbi:MAG: hypothetical protein C0626_01570 [Arcobacter sp.]|uniref:hypothetical protein n=1 Tax=uncultured Arcobacter sp. TaxID=165434 RepID=UPI000CB7C3DA|nr:hypothetical protein [uncultured Arcobacter sp.]PLY11284.1 MAG: hypothetical protein C0626_01570 [Arcobacter sp.]
MTNIYYPSEESLGHLDGTRTINSLLWKFLYKRVQKRLDNSIINIENMRKIVFNKKLLLQCKIDSNLPFVILRREPSWYYADDSQEYFIPFSICFMDGKRKYDIVLVDGKIDLRDDSKRGENLDNKLSHTPVLLVKVFKNIEKSFEVLLDYMKKEDESFLAK